MLSLFTIRAAAVILAGMYAMRSTYGPIEGKFPPLTFLAATIFIFCVVIFHRVPQSFGLWAYVVLGGCVVGFGVNILFLRAAPLISTEGMISLFSVACWVILGTSLGWSLLASKTQ
jgi:hypothetical protein